MTISHIFCKRRCVSRSKSLLWPLLLVASEGIALPLPDRAVADTNATATTELFEEPLMQVTTIAPQAHLAHGLESAVDADETFDGTWPFEAHYIGIKDAQMHYVDEGAGDETLLLLHGEPTWGYLFRHQIAEWSREARVIAPDHLGFGKSAVPVDRTYWVQDHIDNLETFVLELDLKGLTLVMHDFGGPVGMGLAARHPDRIRRIVSLNGPTPFGQPDLADRLTANAKVSPWFRWIIEADNDGTLETVLGNLDYNILSTLNLNGFERTSIINDTWISAYGAPFPSPLHALGPIGWAKGVATGTHQFEVPDEDARKRITRLPALAIWGQEDRTLHATHLLPLFTDLFPDAEAHVLAGVGHYSPEDASEDITRLVRDFIFGP
ncbi:alpha/beta fold hydrolase [Roseobacter sp. YSTF-M11]|uniref:Alpha/beta fold hydrolase n=1 Tax=Roseobacter insulae TaxID=2859783 RepID=A0A9X1JZL8_9RHOB|nr:alpha/beta fold hydrolase [Roseobacter insulae]MBW4709516.1 alpha/beta fold hydrolase [Roseobacter insulae]